MTILDLIERESGYIFRKETATEFGGACPFCNSRAGGDRFNIWPMEGRYWCRQCGKQGDAIQFMRDYKQLTYQQAVEHVQASGIELRNNDARPAQDSYRKEAQPINYPNDTWLEHAWEFVFDCQAHLMERGTNPKAKAWLNGRTLTDETLWAAGIGYNPADRWLDRSLWGLAFKIGDNGRPMRLWLPRGITIPWVIDGELWGISIRQAKGDPKYYWIPGGTPALYNFNKLMPGRPAVLVEGEIDALTIQQMAGDIVSAVATGSTQRAHQVKWIARLSLASKVLVAYDNDANEAGDKGAEYWLDALKNAIRWRPYWGDVNDMAQANVNVRRWAEMGLQVTA